MRFYEAVHYYVGHFTFINPHDFAEELGLPSRLVLFNDLTDEEAIQVVGKLAEHMHLSPAVVERALRTGAHVVRKPHDFVRDQIRATLAGAGALICAQTGEQR